MVPNLIIIFLTSFFQSSLLGSLWIHRTSKLYSKDWAYQKRPPIVCHRSIAQAFPCDYNVKQDEELCFTLWNSSGFDPFPQFSHHCDLVHTILDYLPSNLHYYPDIRAPDLQICVFGISTGGLTDISKVVFIFCFPNPSHLSRVLQHGN